MFIIEDAKGVQWIVDNSKVEMDMYYVGYKMDNLNDSCFMEKKITESVKIRDATPEEFKRVQKHLRGDLGLGERLV